MRKWTNLYSIHLFCNKYLNIYSIHKTRPRFSANKNDSNIHQKKISKSFHSFVEFYLSHQRQYKRNSPIALFSTINKSKESPYFRSPECFQKYFSLGTLNNLFTPAKPLKPIGLKRRVTKNFNFTYVKFFRQLLIAFQITHRSSDL